MNHQWCHFPFSSDNIVVVEDLWVMIAMPMQSENMKESAQFEGFGAKKHGDGWASNYGSAKLVSALKTVL